MSSEGENKDRLFVEIISNGTVIDHIKAGYGLTVLRILGFENKSESLITMGMNVNSKTSKSGKKDILKVADHYLDESQLHQIALLSPESKVSFIENYKVKEKMVLVVPDRIHGIISCSNQNCVSNKEREPIEPEFDVISKQPLKISCIYCEKILYRPEILSLF